MHNHILVHACLPTYKEQEGGGRERERENETDRYPRKHMF